MYLHTHTIPGSRSNELGVLPSPELDTLLHYAKVLSDTKQRDHIDLMVVMLLSNVSLCPEKNKVQGVLSCLTHSFFLILSLSLLFYRNMLENFLPYLQSVLNRTIYRICGLFVASSVHCVSKTKQQQWTRQLMVFLVNERNSVMGGYGYDSRTSDRQAYSWCCECI